MCGNSDFFLLAFWYEHLIHTCEKQKVIDGREEPSERKWKRNPAGLNYLNVYSKHATYCERHGNAYYLFSEYLPIPPMRREVTNFFGLQRPTDRWLILMQTTNSFTYRNPSTIIPNKFCRLAQASAVVLSLWCIACCKIYTGIHFGCKCNIQVRCSFWNSIMTCFNTDSRCHHTSLPPSPSNIEVKWLTQKKIFASYKQKWKTKKRLLIIIQHLANILDRVYEPQKNISFTMCSHTRICNVIECRHRHCWQ